MSESEMVDDTSMTTIGSFIAAISTGIFAYWRKGKKSGDADGSVIDLAMEIGEVRGKLEVLQDTVVENGKRLDAFSVEIEEIKALLGEIRNEIKGTDDV